MKVHRILGVFWRYFYLILKLDQLCDLFYWHMIDILLWGITSVWLGNQEQAGTGSLVVSILSGIVLWQVMWRANYEVAVNLLQEFWNRNLVNLFSTPLKFSEWIAGVMLMGIVKIGIGLVFGSIAVYLLYSLNVFQVGWAFLPFCASLALSGWWIGFLSNSIIIYYGQRFQMLAWMFVYGFLPFTAVYYPVSALPWWAQAVAKLLPMSYVFEGMRSVLHQGVFSLRLLGMSFLLNGIYTVLSFCLFKWMFEKSRAKGLSRLE